MALGPSHPPLVWIDMEMTGLDPDRDCVIEIATLVTDSELRILAEGPELVIHQHDDVLEGMDDWNREHHGASGLIERVRASKTTEQQAQELTLRFLERHCEPGQAPLAGNSVWQDRRFLRSFMPSLDSFLHYRIVDVSTIKELVMRWYPEVFQRTPVKRSTHRALDDIRESIEELRYYRETVFRPRSV